ncbi:alpha/beta fold hydrolase [Leptospira ilyithenensis]|uniref:Alpha/beta hydrolase n=1 Tax=Leptospira ilyithenensis TaxID=2484901 RepID=A0A4R9LSR3_9LEPT|nr:alpha/beta hydrolase [Leptospira ilyithenensis]TGN14527.1 alpha/beta hydrolase [Leptospira ilyithenensis]
MQQDTQFILIHGAGLGAWIWRDVISRLKYPTLALEFPNRNKPDSKKANTAKLTFEDYISFLKKQIEIGSRTKSKLVIVAHSIGGVIGLRLAEDFQDRVNGFIGISASIPKEGGSFVSSLPYPNKIIVSTVMKLFGTLPSEMSIKHGLCGDLTSEQAEEIIGNYSPESENLYFSRTNAGLPNVSRLYIRLENDKEFDIPTQNRMISHFSPDHIIDLESGHMPMLSQPKTLAAILNSFATTMI